MADGDRNWGGEMTVWTLDYPLGAATAPAAQLTRRRAAPGLTLLVQPGDRVRADQVVAEAQDRSRVVLAGIAGRVREAVPGREVSIEGQVMYLWRNCFAA